MEYYSPMCCKEFHVKNNPQMTIVIVVLSGQDIGITRTDIIPLFPQVEDVISFRKCHLGEKSLSYRACV